MENQTLQIIGLVASIIIALSMTMSSFVKFRIINLIGATTFAVYGFLIHAYPVGILNSFIVIVDIYYLRKIFSKQEVFETLEIRPDNRYLLRFLEFHQKEIKIFFPEFNYNYESNCMSFLILRDMAVAGVFLAEKHSENTVIVNLDFVLKQYRDYKNGKYVYHRLKEFFKQKGISKVVSTGKNKKYIKYLKKMGFIERKGLYIIDLEKY